MTSSVDIDGLQRDNAFFSLFSSWPSAGLKSPWQPTPHLNASRHHHHRRALCRRVCSSPSTRAVLCAPPSGPSQARRGRARVPGPRPLSRDATGRAARAPLGSCGGGWCGRSRQGWEEEEVRGEESERDMRQPSRKRERVRWGRSEF